MRVTIIENTRVTHHGQIGVALAERAARLEVIRPWAGEALPRRIEADGLVVFGGEQSALDDARSPWLPHLVEQMAEHAQADRALMGICLGSQLLARAFGAKNHLGTATEVGWHEVELTEAGQLDPVFGGGPARFPIFQIHSDTFDIPEGAVHLARSAVAASQAFRVGRAAYGTQFHFEAHRQVVQDWVDSVPEVIEQMAPGWLARHATEAAELGAKADTHGLRMARAFVAQI